MPVERRCFDIDVVNLQSECYPCYLDLLGTRPLKGPLRVSWCRTPPNGIYARYTLVLQYHGPKQCPNQIICCLLFNETTVLCLDSDKKQTEVLSQAIPKRGDGTQTKICLGDVKRGFLEGTQRCCHLVTGNYSTGVPHSERPRVLLYG